MWRGGDVILMAVVEIDRQMRMRERGLVMGFVSVVRIIFTRSGSSWDPGKGVLWMVKR